MNLSEKQVTSIKTYFRDKPIMKAYLFGSYARGEANEKSDIDLLIELDPEIPIGLEFAQFKIDLVELLASDVDLVTTNGVSKYLKPLIDRDKIMLYER
ncbi:MAG: nucleotidyltransferase domain-containing protein [Cyclobacteriaceae bacterium]